MSHSIESIRIRNSPIDRIDKILRFDNSSHLSRRNSLSLRAPVASGELGRARGYSTRDDRARWVEGPTSAPMIVVVVSRTRSEGERRGPSSPLSALITAASQPRQSEPVARRASVAKLAFLAQSERRELSTAAVARFKRHSAFIRVHRGRG